MQLNHDKSKHITFTLRKNTSIPQTDTVYCFCLTFDKRMIWGAYENGTYILNKRLKLHYQPYIYKLKTCPYLLKPNGATPHKNMKKPSNS